MVNIEFTTLTALVDWYENKKIPNYIIYRGGSAKDINISDVYSNNDLEEGGENLLSFCNRVLSEPSNENIYYIKLQGSGKAKDITPAGTFCLNVPKSRFAAAAPYPDLLRLSSPNNNNEILSRLAAIENNLQPIEEEEEDEQNYIGTLLNEPSIKNLLISGIGSILANFLTPVSAASPVTALAGVDETTENLQQYITNLFAKGVTVSDLKTLSEKSESELNLLLSILRK